MGERKRAEDDYSAIRAERIAEMIGLGFTDEQAAAEARIAEQRVRAREAYARGLIERLKAANRALDEAWFRWLGEHPDHEELPVPSFPEQDAVDAVFAEIDAVMVDRWPQHLHFPGV